MGNRLRKVFVFLSIAGLLGFFLVSCEHNSINGKVLLTVVKDSEQLEIYRSSVNKGRLPGAAILAIDPMDPQAEPKEISNNFYSACFPDITYDGQKMLFSAQVKQGDIWQIFEMDLTDFSSKQLTNAEYDCSEPKYLPGGRVVYSQVVSKEEELQSLMVLQEGYSESRQITFSPKSYSGTEVLHDGRIISVSQSLNEEANLAKVMVMRPDGTKELLFYDGNESGQLIGKPREIQTKEILLLEKEAEGRSVLFSLNYNDPLNSKKRLSNHIKGDFAGIGSSYGNNVLVCYKPSADSSYGLYVFDPTSTIEMSPVYQAEEYQFVDAVFVQERQRPKNIPSEVNLEQQTGLLLCQDINFSGYNDATEPKMQKAVKIELLGQKTSLGIVDAEADGSVYLKIKADTPFRIQTLDEKGAVVNGPSDWINLRPNERRACVGCHQGNELVPKNQQPLSVLKDPVEIPILEQLMANN